MRSIQKSSEPSSLVTHRQQAGASYGNLPQNVKTDVRDALLAEQGHLCAYCMQRIYTSSMKIEHWHSQTGHPNEQLHYQNMLGCCRGNEGNPPKNQHCGTRQKDDDILYNPANPAHHSRMQIRYAGDGTIRSDDTDFDSEIDAILNLNNYRMKKNREAVAKAVEQVLGRMPGLRTRTQIQRQLDTWKNRDGVGRLKPYCGTAIYFLEKRLQRAV